MEKKITSHIIKGLIITLITAILDLVAGFAGWKFETWFRWIPTIIFVAAIIWACLNYGSQMEHQVTFGNVFAHGFKTSAVVAVLSLVYFLLSIYLIFPDTKEIAMQKAREQMEADGKLSADQMDTAIDMAKRFFMPFAIAGLILVTMLGGLVASLIGAAVTKKNPVTPFGNQP